MKALHTTFLVSGLLLLGSCMTTAGSSQDTASAAPTTPPARKSATYDEPPVEPATKGPAAEPAKKSHGTGSK